LRQNRDALWRVIYIARSEQQARESEEWRLAARDVDHAPQRVTILAQAPHPSLMFTIV